MLFVMGFVGFLVIFPFFLVFFCPVAGACIAFKNPKVTNLGAKIVCAILGFVLGMSFNICFIPMMLMMAACAIIAVFFRILHTIFKFTIELTPIGRHQREL